MTNHVAAIRSKLNISAAELAKAAGVSRQTIYSVEAGSYLPNTEVGLRLARALGVQMEDLFSLPEEPAAGERMAQAKIVPANPELRTGQAVQVCKVNGKLVASGLETSGCYLPPSDGALASNRREGGSQILIREGGEADFENRLLLAGCDPAMQMVADYLRPGGVRLILLHRNSSQGLDLLKGGYVHLAGSHLQSNVDAVKRRLGAKAVELISFALWQEGLVAAAGNPKGIKAVEDLARPDLKIVNREAGSGSRGLLDRQLKRIGLPSQRVRGYETAVSGHMAAVGEIHSGQADCCMSTEAAARFFGLHFIPLETVRYEFVIRKQQLKEPAVQAFLNDIHRLAFRRKLAQFAGYDVSVCGVRRVDEAG